MAFQVSKHRWLCWLLCPQATGSSFCSAASKKKRAAKRVKCDILARRRSEAETKTAQETERVASKVIIFQKTKVCVKLKKHSFCKALNKEGLCTVLKFNEKIFLIKQIHDGTTCTFSLLYQGRNMCAQVRISTTETFLGVDKLQKYYICNCNISRTLRNTCVIYLALTYGNFPWIGKSDPINILRQAPQGFLSDPTPIIGNPCHWLSNWLTLWWLLDLIDVTLACEDANSKLVEVVTVANVDDEDRVGNSLLQIWKLRFGHKA